MEGGQELADAITTLIEVRQTLQEIIEFRNLQAPASSGGTLLDAAHRHALDIHDYLETYAWTNTPRRSTN